MMVGLLVWHKQKQFLLCFLLFHIYVFASQYDNTLFPITLFLCLK